MKKANNFFLKPFILVFFISSLALSCKSDAGKQEGETRGQEPPATAADAAPQAAPGLISNAGQLPGLIDYEGEFQQGATWPGPGQKSVCYAVVSKYEQGEFFSPGWVSRLNIYFFELTSGQITSRRSFQAEAPNIYSEASLLKERSQVIGLSSMGTAYSIVYSICPDGEDPCTFYCSVIGEGAKYDFQVKEDVDKSVYFEEQAAIMEGIPDDVQQHILKQLFPE